MGVKGLNYGGFQTKKIYNFLFGLFINVILLPFHLLNFFFFYLKFISLFFIDIFMLEDEVKIKRQNRFSRKKIIFYI